MFFTEYPYDLSYKLLLHVFIEAKHGLQRHCTGIRMLKICFTIILRSSNPKMIVGQGNTKGGSITVLLTSCLTGLD